MKAENTKHLALNTASLSQEKKNYPIHVQLGRKKSGKTVVVEETCFFLNTVNRAATETYNDEGLLRLKKTVIQEMLLTKWKGYFKKSDTPALQDINTPTEGFFW